MNTVNTVNRYTLAPYRGRSSRHKCPSCGARNEFSRYIDTESGNELADHVGRCNREDHCGYHYKPKEYFEENPTQRDNRPITKDEIKEPGPVQFLPYEILEQSVAAFKKCSLFPFLTTLFTKDVAERLCYEYLIGATKAGNTVFWQADLNGNIRQAKVICYNPETGKRNKETNPVFIGKKILGDYEANLQQCFFGEYLLSVYKNKTVGIVESEKTAIIASIYYPELVWIATGGKHGARWTEKNVCKVLKDREVVLFPDLAAYEVWKQKGKLLSNVAGCKVVVSDTLERYATDEERDMGLDIADYLLKKRSKYGLALNDYGEGYPIIFDNNERT